MKSFHPSSHKTSWPSHLNQKHTHCSSSVHNYCLILLNTDFKRNHSWDDIITISQSAHHTTLCLKDVLHIIQISSKASALHFNINKCELMSLKLCDSPSICGVPIKTEISYLGLKIVKDEERRCELNICSVIDKMKNKLNQCLLRDFSLRTSQDSHIQLFLQQSTIVFTRLLTICFSVFYGEIKPIIWRNQLKMEDWTSWTLALLIILLK